MEPFVGIGANLGFTPRAYQQALATGPFGKNCEADVVSPEAVMRGLQDRDVYNQGNIKGILYNSNHGIHISFTREIYSTQL
jgi:hypothetical protein